MDKEILKKNSISIACLLVLIFGIIIRFYPLQFKDYLNYDETCSIFFANRSNYIPRENHLSGKEIKTIMLWNDASLSDALSDIKNLYFDSGDLPHTNLYYSLFRLTFIGVSEFNLKQTVIRGWILNICILCIGFFFMFKLLQLLFGKKNSLVPFGLFITFFNSAAISNAFFFRPYQLQEASFIIVTYYFTKFYLYKKINWLKLVAAIAFCLLTGYFSLIYVLLLFFVLFFKLPYKKFLLKIGILTSLFTAICYPKYWFGYTCWQAKGSYAIFQHISQNLPSSINSLFFFYSKYLFTVLILAYIVYLILKIITQELTNTRDISSVGQYTAQKSVTLIIIICSFIWSFISMYAAPIKNFRYIQPMFPISSLLIPYFVNFFNHKKQHFIIFSLIFILNISVALSLVKCQKQLNFYIPQFTKILPFDKDYDVVDIKKDDIILYKKDLPVVIAYYTFWYNPFVSHMNDNQSYYFLTRKDYKIPYYNCFVLFNNEYKLQDIINDENFKILEIQDISTTTRVAEIIRRTEK